VSQLSMIPYRQEHGVTDDCCWTAALGSAGEGGSRRRRSGRSCSAEPPKHHHSLDGPMRLLLQLPSSVASDAAGARFGGRRPTRQMTSSRSGMT
jgi:hypothetical protein